MIVGGALAVIALIAMLRPGEPETVAAPSASTAPSTSPTTSATTTEVPSTSSTTEPPTTTAPTTSTTIPVDAIATFVTEFAALIDAGDADVLFDRLHPAVLEAQDADLCRAFIEREILELRDYRLTGDITGPVATTFGSMTVEMYTAPVAFTFQGTAFDGSASFALLDGEVRWFATCR